MRWCKLAVGQRPSPELAQVCGNACLGTPGEPAEANTRDALSRIAAPVAHQTALDMDIDNNVKRILDEVLSLGGRAASFTLDTHLLGAIPELDSMAVVSLITALEERMGITIDDDDIGGDTFATYGSLLALVQSRLNA